MTTDPLIPKILLFSIPLILSQILQLLFHAADIIVVGRFSGAQALAAVGGTIAVVNVVLYLITGLASGVNVVASHAYGAKDSDAFSRTLHTALLMSLAFGIGFLLLGTACSVPLLRLVRTPEEIFDQSCAYLRIYFFGLPAIAFYNCGAAMLRSIGDTKRPLYFLLFSGILNVILNCIFVICFGLGVAGVALATVLSNYMSAALVSYALLTDSGMLRISFSELRIHRDKLSEILNIGIPSAFEHSVFTLTNLIVQASINSLGTGCMAGNAAAANTEAFVYTIIFGVDAAAMTILSQNIGAGKYARTDRAFKTVTLLGMGSLLFFGSIMALFATPLLSIFNTDPDVISFGRQRLVFMCLIYFWEAPVHSFGAAFRAFRHPRIPVICTMITLCLFRPFWLLYVFPLHRTYLTILAVWPLTWTILIVIYSLLFRRVRREFPME